MYAYWETIIANVHHEGAWLLPKSYNEKQALLSLTIQHAQQLSREQMRAQLSGLTPVATGTLSADGSWSYVGSFPKYDPNGNEYHYVAVERSLAGYEDSYVVNGNRTVIQTTAQPETTDFTFHKVWYPAGDSTERQPWQKDITVTLCEGVDANATAIATYTIAAGQYGLVATGISRVDGQEVPAIAVNAASGNDFSFTISGLPADKAYSLVEGPLDMNLTKYGSMEGEAITINPTASRAVADTPYIINRNTAGVELPAAGGPGTGTFVALGSGMVSAGLALLARRKRRNG